MNIEEINWTTLIIAPLLVLLLGVFFNWIKTRVSNGIYRIRHLKKHKCGHISWSYTILENGETECSECGQAKKMGKAEFTIWLNNKHKEEKKNLIVLYILLDVIFAGAGMGVPIFCILLGFPLGWYITKKISVSMKNSHMRYRQILKWSLLASVFTFLEMIVIWGRTIPMLFDPKSNFQNFGHPFILYDPKLSFIGWLILMIFVSPFLQLLTTIFASFVTLAKKETE